MAGSRYDQYNGWVVHQLRHGNHAEYQHHPEHRHGNDPEHQL